MSSTIEALFPNQQGAADSVVSALNHQEILVALSALVADRRVAVLHMLYPRTDARTHRSLDALVSTLHGHGLHEVATLVSQEAHYLVFKDPAKAWKAFRKSATTRWRSGCTFTTRLSGDDAEKSLDADAHQKADTPVRRF